MPKNRPRSQPIDPPVSRFRLQIRRSRIHGRGVFAREIIPPRKVIIEYAGDRITYREMMRRFVKRGRPRRICFARLDKRWIIDGLNGNGSEYINHSCEPNMHHWRPRGHIFLCSRRPIVPGEELTFDYRLSPALGRVPCHCGAKKCRGQMNRPAKRGELAKTRRS